MTLGNGGTLAFSNVNGMTYAGPISGSGSLIKSGGGMLILTGNNTYTGSTAIDAGTLQLGNGGAAGSISDSSSITDNAALVYDLYGSQSYSGVISGSGSMAQAGSGTLTLSGTNTYSGGTTLDAGTLDFAAGAIPLGTSAITFDGGTLQWAAGNSEDVSSGIAPIATGETAMVDTNGNNVTFASSLSGAGGLTKLGDGTLTLSADNSGLTGQTAVAGGVSGGHDHRRTARLEHTGRDLGFQRRDTGCDGDGRRIERVVVRRHRHASKRRVTLATARCWASTPTTPAAASAIRALSATRPAARWASTSSATTR